MNSVSWVSFATLLACFFRVYQPFAAPDAGWLSTLMNPKEAYGNRRNNEAVESDFPVYDRGWRMDRSLSYAIQRLIGMKDRFALSFASNTDHDLHAIVTKSEGLLPAPSKWRQRDFIGRRQAKQGRA